MKKIIIESKLAENIKALYPVPDALPKPLPPNPPLASPNPDPPNPPLDDELLRDRNCRINHNIQSMIYLSIQRIAPHITMKMISAQFLFFSENDTNFTSLNYYRLKAKAKQTKYFF